jgi:EAL domain-containing protein (putative c-di-GMP-specific phosphodiesterase class I)/GGDEF domain-containing protein
MRQQLDASRAVQITLLVVLAAIGARFLTPLPIERLPLIWAPAGILFAACWKYGWRGLLAGWVGLLPGVLITLTGKPWLFIVCQATIPVIVNLTAVWVLDRFLRIRISPEPERPLERLGWIYRFFIVVACVSAPLAATLGFALFRRFDFLTEYPNDQVFVGYWIVNAYGTVIFAPLMLAIWGRDPGDPRQIPFALRGSNVGGWLDIPSLFLAGAFVSLTALLSMHGLDGYARLLALLVGPFMLWAAMRNGARPAYVTLAVLMTAGVLVRCFATQRGQFTPADSRQVFDMLESLLLFGLASMYFYILQAVMRDRHIAMRDLQRQADTDDVTGLWNERGLRGRLQKAFESSGQTPAGLVAMVFPALSQLAVGVGHERALGVFAALAKRIASTGVLAARMDSTMFVVLLRGQSAAALQSEVELLRTRVAAFRVKVGEGAVPLVCRLGVVVIEQPTADSIDPAMGVLWQMQSSLADEHIESPRMFHLGSEQYLDWRNTLETGIRVRSAIDAGALELYAQSILPNQAQPGPAPGVYCEVLVRLRVEGQELMLPRQFLGILDEFGLIRTLDRLVLHKTFGWFAARRDALAQLSCCSINLSGASLSDVRLAEEIRLLALALELPPEKFSFEITESEAILDPRAAIRTVGALRAAGFGTALDDFGTGLATFAYLKQFPVQAIKIDGAFVRAVNESALDREIIQAIVGVAQSLGLRTIAEYVESDHIRATITELGVQFSQGYAIDHPRPLGEMFAAQSHRGFAVESVERV